MSLRSTCSWRIHRTQTQRLCKVLTRPSQTILVCTCNPPASFISLLIFMPRLRQIPELVHFFVLHTPPTTCLCMCVCIYVIWACMHLLLPACWTTYFTHTPTVRGVLNFLLRTKYYEESPDYQGMNSQKEMGGEEMRQTDIISNKNQLALATYVCCKHAETYHCMHTNTHTNAWNQQ
jgi:hypothetical protein